MTTDPLDDDTPPEEELEMAVEDFTGCDTPGSPEQRIEALKKRTEYLASMGRRIGLDKVESDLTAARQQLARYQALNEGRN
jgi:hypothetical protein